MDVKELIKIKQYQDKSNKLYKNYITYGNFNYVHNYENDYMLIDYFHLERQYRYFDLFNKNKLDNNLLNYLKQNFIDTYSRNTINKFISYYMCTKRLQMYRKINNTKIKVFNTKSVEGKAFKLSIDNINLIGKVSTHPDHKLRQAHESAIGIALNSIAYKTPNFMYYYGSFPCEASVKSNKSCVKYDYPGYPLFENVEGISLGEFMTLSNEENEIFNVIAQIVLSLEIAHKDLKFTHYDLHSSNILVVDMKEKKNIDYVYNDNIFAINTRYLVKIIDYGFSIVIYKGVRYVGDNQFENLGISKSSSPVNDIVKIFSYMLTTIQIPKCREVIREILGNYVKVEDKNVLNYVNNFTPYFSYILEDKREIKIFDQLKPYVKLYYPKLNSSLEINNVCELLMKS